MTMPVLIGILAAAAVGLLVIGVSRTRAPTGELEERIEEWVQASAREGGRGSSQEEQLSSSLLGRVEQTVAKQSFAARVQEDLAQADMKITVTEYLAVRVGLVLLLFLIGFLLQRNLLVGLMAAVVGFFLPVAYVGSRKGRRLRAFNSQLPDVLDHLYGSLRAGYGLLQSIEWIARQMPNPAAMEFDRVVRETQLGRSLLEALDSMVRRIPSDDLSLIVTAIKIQYEVGGGLAEILEIVSHTIRERVRIQREIQVLTSQQRLSGYVLLFLPIGMFAFLMVVNPDYEMEMLKPGPLLCIPISAVILMIMGWLIMRRIVKIEV